jgi:hypothetical protein
MTMQNDQPTPTDTEAVQEAAPLIKAGPKLEFSPVLARKVNFASAQNGVSVLRRLQIANTGDQAASAIMLHLTATPPILRDKTWRIDHVAAGAEINLADLETPLDTAILAGLDEAEIGQLEFRLGYDGAQTERSQHRIELLARDEWGGLAEMDNTLAAFVSPNQPLVARLLKDTSRLLEASGHPGSMEGYQSGDPLRVGDLLYADRKRPPEPGQPACLPELGGGGDRAQRRRDRPWHADALALPGRAARRLITIWLRKPGRVHPLITENSRNPTGFRPQGVGTR